MRRWNMVKWGYFSCHKLQLDKTWIRKHKGKTSNTAKRFQLWKYQTSICRFHIGTSSCQSKFTSNLDEYFRLLFRVFSELSFWSYWHCVKVIKAISLSHCRTSRSEVGIKLYLQLIFLQNEQRIKTSLLALGLA